MRMSSRSSKPVILVVDDTPENLALICNFLIDEYKVLLSSSGVRALEIAHSYPKPDLILLDVLMPDMDGYAVLKQLKADRRTSDIPVIFVTAMAGEKEEFYGLSLGVVDYITKPVHPAILKAWVKNHLQWKLSQDMLSQQNLWLQQEVQQRVTAYQKAQDVTMRVLASLADARGDNEGGHHISRTQAFVRILAEDLAKQPRDASLLTPDVIEAYVRAVPLHDIGKVGIPDEILLKPSKLTPDECEIMKTHAQLGAEALWRVVRDDPDQDSLAFLQPGIDIAWHYHERWDGTGYPSGLRGEAIPLSARLMALADAFDSLMSGSKYKPALSFEETDRVILEGRGTHFDPEIVDAYCRQRPAFRAVVSQLADPAWTQGLQAA